MNRVHFSFSNYVLWKIFLECVRLKYFPFQYDFYSCVLFGFCIDSKVIIYNTRQNCLLFQTRSIYIWSLLLFWGNA